MKFGEANSAGTAGLAKCICIPTAEITPELQQRYLGAERGATYLFRPDQHVQARWLEATPTGLSDALKMAQGLK